MYLARLSSKRARETKNQGVCTDSCSQWLRCKFSDRASEKGPSKLINHLNGFIGGQLIMLNDNRLIMRNTVVKTVSSCIFWCFFFGVISSSDEGKLFYLNLSEG